MQMKPDRDAVSPTVSAGDIVVLREYQALYFAIPKVANTSLKAVCAEWVRSKLDSEALARFWSDTWKPRLFRDGESRRYLRRKGILLPRSRVPEFESYWKFGFVRNPWDRLVSCWKQKIQPEGVAPSLATHAGFEAGMRFSDFVDVVSQIPDCEANGHFRSQHKFLEDENGDLLVDFVGRLERLDEDFLHVCRRIGAPGTSLPHLLKSDRRAYQLYFNASGRRFVELRYARDIELFGYTF